MDILVVRELRGLLVLLFEALGDGVRQGQFDFVNLLLGTVLGLGAVGDYVLRVPLRLQIGILLELEPAGHDA